MNNYKSTFFFLPSTSHFVLVFSACYGGDNPSRGQNIHEPRAHPAQGGDITTIHHQDQRFVSLLVTIMGKTEIP